jgi:mono/diheme cytochrome c family protein
MGSQRRITMKKLLVLIPFLLYAQEDFISHYEYGQMLYENPRGVGCAQCHGKSGEGSVIVEYTDANGKQALRGSDIRRESLQTMIKSVKSYHEVMPRYYLTKAEVKAIYDYLQEKNKAYLANYKESNTTQ